MHDILETTELDELKIGDLIADNIKFAIERELGKGAVIYAHADTGDADLEEPMTTILGTYEVSFKDNSDYNGNFVADGSVTNGEFELISITFGSTELKYFGV